MALIVRDPNSPGTVPAPASPNADETRKRYLNHEASLQAIGSLYLLGSVILAGLGLAGLFGFTQVEPGNPGASMLASGFFVFFAAAEGWIGWHLRKLDPRAKIPATLLAGLGLLAFPAGTLINAYVLYLLLSAKGKYVFSPEYRDIIAATPHIRYRMSWIVWGFIWLVIALLLVAVIAALFSKH